MKLVFFLAILLYASISLAKYSPGNIYDGQNGKRVALDTIINEAQAGSVVLLSEIHNSEAHHSNQVDFLVKLAQSRKSLSVGMEFFNYLQQPLVDQYTRNEISEEEFLESINWGGFPFEYYRFQVRLPFYSGGKTVALNAPRSLTSRISQVGIEGLNQEEATLMPPNFVMGNDAYFERFKAAMGDHGSQYPDMLWRYFQAQSVWDDTMAWQTQVYMNQNPEQVFVIIVGDFHVQYGGGLPDRLQQRGISKIINISQIQTRGLSKEEIASMVEPHPEYGPRADYIWVSN
tara:strand:+ start:8916 stop:9779 length:864 start_codon:yes stop_codon:yes gene_type:complete